MVEKASIGHFAIKVKDINGTVKLLEDLLGFKVDRKAGEGETPLHVWFEEGLQLVSDPDFNGPEGRLHHIGVIVPDKDEIIEKCKELSFSEVRPGWYALPNGIVLEFLTQ